MLAINILLVILLIALTAFFVASEFAIVKVRGSRIDQLIAQGNKKAVNAKRLLSNLDGYLSATQLGITVTALGLGWLGEPTVQVILTPIFEKFDVPESLVSILSFIIAFSTITFIHVVAGELAPKTFAIHKAEEITLSVAAPLIIFYKIMYPFIWALNGTARSIVSMFGLKPASEGELAHSEEELRIILSESLKSGEINQSEYRYVNRIFEFDNRIAKEIMVPRVEVYSIDKSASIEEIIGTIRAERFTRYPVTDGDKDTIIGVVNVKEFLSDCIGGNCMGTEPIMPYVKPVIRVIETIPIQSLLVKMQKERMHMAVLFDEYGGTAGLITVEDILEEIVGDIRDEFDTDEIPNVRKLSDDHYLLDAKMLIEEVNSLLGVHLSGEEVDTIGGWLLTQKYDLQEGDTLTADNYHFHVHTMEGSHISVVEVEKEKKK
ncbi:hemolysin family protein [Lederbergia wuyishanensis]|uniref:CBS domain containing-hemolysin-like protein n=1 Tax=Lederbergia wuyishanensis TaxID=1347903 RepID=A0ABU0D9Z8_9BACI|nr:hemolysin family protein [Lederbergia wuyishanensis]MCJ8008488.1 hemolysin family protein [Lederbergia wuyishanensis]MDQ0345231.1 CBS domain containing-hemolysin-like protein [Lederbergia wuyishanensis]